MSNDSKGNIKIRLLFIFITVILFSLSLGCAERDLNVENADKTLLKSETVKIYNIDIDKMLRERGYYKKLHEFPFISTEAMLDFKGNFPVDFYQSFNYNVKAEDIKDVNFWTLRDYPFSLDVIYVKPVWLENFKYVGKDLFENICYSFNISKREQEILKWWIKSGGILWVESGIYATGFENIERDGTINLKAIKKRIYRLTNGLHFLEFPVKSTVYLSSNRGLTTYKKHIVSFGNLKTKNKYLQDIKLLQVKLNHPIEALFSINYKPSLVDGRGIPLLTIVPYAEGKIIFLFPFEYVDSYRDGELLRWRLLQYIYTHPHFTARGTGPKIKYDNEKKIIHKSEKKIKENKEVRKNLDKKNIIRKEQKVMDKTDKIPKQNNKIKNNEKEPDKEIKKKKEKKIKKVQQLI